MLIQTQINVKFIKELALKEKAWIEKKREESWEKSCKFYNDHRWWWQKELTLEEYKYKRNDVPFYGILYWDAMRVCNNILTTIENGKLLDTDNISIDSESLSLIKLNEI